MKKITLSILILLGAAVILQAQDVGTGVKQKKYDRNTVVTPDSKKPDQPNVSEKTSQPTNSSEEKFVYLYRADQKKKSEILNQYIGMYSFLPYSADHIQNVILPGLFKERITYAPHYPAQEDAASVNHWLDNYTDELIRYLVYLEETYIAYKKSSNYK